MVNEGKVAAFVDEEGSVAGLGGSEEACHLWSEPRNRTYHDVCMGYFSM